MGADLWRVGVSMTSSSFDPSRIRRASWWAFLGFLGFVALMATLIVQIDEQALSRLMNLGWPLVSLLLGLSVVNYGLRAVRWELFSAQLDLSVPLLRNGCYYVAGFSMTPTPGKLGELMRLWLIRRGHGVTLHQSLPLVLGDRVGDTYAVIALSLVSGAMLGEQLPLLMLVCVGLAVMTGFLLYPQPLITLVDAIYRRIKRYPQAFVAIRHALHQLNHLMAPRIALPALLLSLLGWFAECAALYGLLYALDAPIGILHAVFAFTFSMFVGGLSLLPGGLGATEAGLAFILIGFGVDTPIALLATTIIRLTTLWFAVALGLLALPFALHLSQPTPADESRESQTI